jgi:hypothetical protein
MDQIPEVKIDQIFYEDKVRMGLINFFQKLRSKGKSPVEVQKGLCNNYLKTLVRYQGRTAEIARISSHYFKTPYVNDGILEMVSGSVILGSLESDDAEVALYEDVLNGRLNYDDFITLFSLYFDYDSDQNSDIEKSGKVIQEFVRPYYLKGKRKGSVMKLILYLFLFHLYYTQFYLLMNEFLEIPKGDIEYYLYLFLHNVERDNVNAERKGVFSYQWFDTYIKKLYEYYYLSIHYIQDVTAVVFPFDIHSTRDLKSNFIKRIAVIPSSASSPNPC